MILTAIKPNELRFRKSVLIFGENDDYEYIKLENPIDNNYVESFYYNKSDFLIWLYVYARNKNIELNFASDDEFSEFVNAHFENIVISAAHELDFSKKIEETNKSKNEKIFKRKVIIAQPDECHVSRVGEGCHPTITY